MLGSTHLGSRMLLLMGLDTCSDDPTFSPNWATRVAKKRYSLFFRLHFRTHPSQPCRCATPLWCVHRYGATAVPDLLPGACTALPLHARPHLPDCHCCLRCRCHLPGAVQPLTGFHATARPLPSFSSTMTAQLSPAMQCFVRPPTKFCWKRILQAYVLSVSDVLEVCC
jgi:hypothetical protein